MSLTDEDIQHNKDLAVKLLNNFSYIYKDINDLRGMFEYRILGEVITRQFFNKKSHSEGILYSAAFNPIPLALIALVFTAVHIAIEQWKSGITSVSRRSFKETEYHPIYQQHLQGLDKWKNFNNNTTRALAKHQQNLYSLGSKFTGFNWKPNVSSDPFAEDHLAHAAATLDDDFDF
ncbi:hypothetical protein M422DRAFT_262087 [Sphaerobolus stellatus SS14]|uniref:DUF6532 domain-containing protein n=1 Tax=Sphaerobolus stellatus (strain SS14) TaxID=990650 RepID=A0A0C9VE36_SPHS4|nr:hypothetical protein M422DRAFT_262087 [Sphaerobolus stellatus SS14]